MGSVAGKATAKPRTQVGNPLLVRICFIRSSLRSTSSIATPALPFLFLVRHQVLNTAQSRQACEDQRGVWDRTYGRALDTSASSSPSESEILSCLSSDMQDCSFKLATALCCNGFGRQFRKYSIECRSICLEMVGDLDRVAHLLISNTQTLVYMKYIRLLTKKK